MDLNRLQIFAAVAESASFSAAAEKLGLPKSSVSREVARLEEDTGVRLLHRTTRKVALSTDGAALYERVSPLLAALASAAALPAREDEPAGVLKVTTTADLGAAVLAEIAARFTGRYPEVRIEVVITNRVVDLVAEGIDVGLRVSLGQLRDSALAARRLGTLSMELYASPQYVARRGAPRSLADLAEHDRIGFPGVRLFEEGPPPRISADDMFFVRECLRADAGIGILPTFLAESDLLSGALVRVLPEWVSESGTVWFVYPGGSHAPAKVTAFRDFVADALRRRPLTPS